MTATTEAPPAPRLKERYQSEIAPGLREEFGYANVMQVPGLSKIVVNMGVGEAARDAKLIEGAVRDLSLITGQKPAVARAKKSIAQFKLREGMPIGAHVTLRGARMWEFADRLLTVAKKALVNKAARKPKFAVRGYTRCQRCGRPHSVYRKFGLCRICFREMAHAGQLPGITKSSW